MDPHQGQLRVSAPPGPAGARPHHHRLSYSPFPGHFISPSATKSIKAKLYFTESFLHVSSCASSLTCRVRRSHCPACPTLTGPAWPRPPHEGFLLWLDVPLSHLHICPLSSPRLRPLLFPNLSPKSVLSTVWLSQLKTSHTEKRTAVEEGTA